MNVPHGKIGDFPVYAGRTDREAPKAQSTPGQSGLRVYGQTPRMDRRPQRKVGGMSRLKQLRVPVETTHHVVAIVGRQGEDRSVHPRFGGPVECLAVR